MTVSPQGGRWSVHRLRPDTSVRQLPRFPPVVRYALPASVSSICKRPADQTGEAILIPTMCCDDVTVRFRRGVRRADDRLAQNLGNFISIGWSRQHVPGRLGARFAQYSRLLRADACARFSAPWRMYQANVERSTPIVKILVSRVLSTTSVLSTTASRSRTGDICVRRRQTFALRVAWGSARARTQTVVSTASVVTKVAIPRITPGERCRSSIRRSRRFALSRRRTGAGICQACSVSGSPGRWDLGHQRPSSRLRSASFEADCLRQGDALICNLYNRLLLL